MLSAERECQAGIVYYEEVIQPEFTRFWHASVWLLIWWLKVLQQKVLIPSGPGACSESRWTGLGSSESGRATSGSNVPSRLSGVK